MNAMYFQELMDKVPFNDAIQYFLRVVSAAKVSKFKVYMTYCPHCEEPKMKVNPIKKVMFCQECGFGGDLLAVIAKSEDTTPKDMANRLIDKYEIKMESHVNPLQAR